MARADIIPQDKDAAQTANPDPGLSTNTTYEVDGDYGSNGDHIFTDDSVTQYWVKVYEHAKYEGRHRFDPNYKWSAKEEKRILRKVVISLISAHDLDAKLTHLQIDWRIMLWAWIMFVALDLNRKNINRAVSDNLLADLSMMQC